jgi:choline-sulfatase
MPSRASFWTSRYPHETTVLSNFGPGCGKVPDEMKGLGEIFSSGGYEAVYFGKTHDGGSLRGFHTEKEESLPVAGTDVWPAGEGTRRDRYTTTRIVEYLRGRKEKGKPFLAVASLLNPHDICAWVGLFKGPHVDPPVEGPLPELPDNFEIDDLKDRPLPVQYLCCSHRRLAQASHWNKTNYQSYLAAYRHYVSLTDGEIGLILEALAGSPQAKNTLVVLLADHGDGMASHRMVTKETSFYEETTRVPFIFSGPGVEGRNAVLEGPLVSLLDLLPTLCDIAGLEIPALTRGKSLLPWIRGQVPTAFRDAVFAEWYTEAGFAKVVTPGRMIRTERFKYTRYIEGSGEELFDLEKDPGERRTLVHDPDYVGVLKDLRQRLDRHLRETRDPFLSLKASRGHALHPLGYGNH